MTSPGMASKATKPPEDGVEAPENCEGHVGGDGGPSSQSCLQVPLFISIIPQIGGEAEV